MAVNSYSQTFKVNSILTFLTVCFIGIAGLMSNLIIQKEFGNESLGVYNYTISAFMIVTTISSFGLRRSLVYFCALHRDDSKKLKSFINAGIVIGVTWSITVGLLSAVLLILCKDFIDSDTINHMSILIWCVPVYVVNNICIAVFNGLGEMKVYSLQRAIRWALLLTAVFYVAQGLPFKLVFISYLFSEYTLLIVTLFNMYRLRLFSFSWSFHSARELIIYGKYMYPSQLVLSLQDNADILLLKLFVGESYLGVYSLASRVGKLLLLLGAAIQSNVNPIISRLHKQGKTDELMEFFGVLKKKLLRIIIISVLGISGLYWIFINVYLRNDLFILYYEGFIIQLISLAILTIFSWSGGLLLMTGMPLPNLYRLMLRLFVFSGVVATISALYGESLGPYIAYAIGALSNLAIDRYFIKKSTQLSIY